MLIENAVLEAKPGPEVPFHRAITERGVPLLVSVPGVKWVKFGCGVETPGKFLFHADFLAVFAPHAIGGTMEHFEVA